jgi:hypothetical protein
MTDGTGRIAALEAENFALRTELERLKPQPRVVKLDGPFALPDLERTERLIRRVFEQYPILRGDIERTFDPGRIEPAEFVRMVRASLAYIGTLHRTRGAPEAAPACTAGMLRVPNCISHSPRASSRRIPICAESLACRSCRPAYCRSAVPGIPPPRVKSPHGARPQSDSFVVMDVLRLL